MNNKYSFGLSVAMLLLLISGSGTLPVPSFSSPADNATTGDIVVSDQNGSPQITSSPDEHLSDTDRLNEFSPDSDNTEEEPTSSNVVLGSSDGSSGSSGITSVSDGSDSNNNLDTVSTPTDEDGSSSDADSVTPSSAETGLNSSGASSSGNGISVPAEVPGGISDSSGSNQVSSSSNDSSTENNQSPDEGTSGVTPSDGSIGSLPSNSTVEVGGSTNPEQSSSESPLNQSSVESPSSTNQSGVTSSNSGFNGSSTGLSTDHAASNETHDVASGPSANGNQLQPSSEDSEISVASASDPNAVTQDVSAGAVQHVSFGDISNQDNVTSIDISLDKSSYNLEDSPKVTISDGEANVDPNAINTIQTRINSTSDETGIPITLTETGPNTGVFEGVFSFTSQPSSAETGAIQVASGDDIGINYTGTHPRMSADIDSVVQGGSVTMKETLTDQSAPAGLIGGAVELTLSDQVVLGPNEVPVPDCPEGSCLGKTTVSLSYANAPLGAQIPEALTIWQYVPGLDWINLRDYQQYQPPGSITTIQVDTDKQTVTAYSPFKGNGVFSIGIDNPGPGGGGGGIGFPGAGIVLDLIAPVTSTPPPSPPPASERPPVTIPDLTGTDDETSATAQGTDPSLVATNSTTSTTGGQPTDAATASIAGAGSSTTLRSGSDTIFIPGEGNITISFENLVSGQNLMASALKTPSDLLSLNITKDTNQVGRLMALDNTPYDVVGTVFIIGPYDARLNGTTTVTIPYDANLTDIDSGPGVRMLHFTGSSWEDVTATPPADGHFVTGTLSTLGPVVAAVKSQ